ncbi:MAG: MBOAT family O-acyltransferase [Acutalibacteraceae bacterium]|nr:MBOAT family O-acyltransferase [Acutalibacteraceae bacterium]
MSYSSFSFLIFSGLAVLVYYIVPKKTQKYVLLFASAFFYVYAGIKYVPFILVTLIATFFAGKKMGEIYEKEALLLKQCTVVAEKKKVKAEHKQLAKKYMLIALFVAAGLLIVCKYTVFALKNVNGLLSAVNLPTFEIFKMIVPLGVSFYTFMAVSYVLDVYWKRYKAEKSFVDYAIYLTWFPHVVQGPIDRYNNFKPQIPTSEGIKFNSETVSSGAQLVIWGLFKKLVIADRLNIFVGEIYGDYQKYTGVILIIATVLYSIQIYADFSGCIDIVSGVSEMFGIKLQKNFNHPYFSKNIPEFWRRWHMSLGEWFKDYIYYPVSISSLVKKVKKQSKNERFTELFVSCCPIFVVWLITGIWHGASWNYVAWGLYYAAIMIAGTVFEPWLMKLNEKLGIDTESFSWKLWQMIRTFIICSVGRVFFRANGLKAALKIFIAMVSGSGMNHVAGEALFNYGLDWKNFVFVFFAILVLWIVDILQEKMSLRQELRKQGIVFRWIVILLGIYAVIVFGIYGPGYDASSFIYEQF